MVKTGLLNNGRCIIYFFLLRQELQEEFLLRQELPFHALPFLYV